MGGISHARNRLALLLWKGLALGVCASAITALPAVAWAQPTADETYKLHMTNGVKLFQDHNYEAAIAEFRAAYKAKPKASPLLNIALAEKALFHYPSAIATLEMAIDRHGADMEAKDKKAAGDAIVDMRSLLAFVNVTMTPAEAQLTIDGEDQPAGTTLKPVPLGPGTHKLEAHMNGYTPAEATVVLASGDKDKTVALTLTADKGYVRIHGGSPSAALSIDEKQVGVSEWAGLVAPGPHIVTMNDRGSAIRVSVLVVAGRSMDVDSRGAAANAPGPAPIVPIAPPPPEKPQPRVSGFYGLVAASLFVPTNHPGDFQSSTTQVGASFGLRAGYRFTTPLGIELMYQYGDISVTGTFNDTPAKYSLASHRLGANLRFMSSGKRARFLLTVGGGVVFDALSTACAGCEGMNGTTGFFNNEIGLEMNFGGVLLSLVGQQVIGTYSDVSAGITLPSSPSLFPSSSSSSSVYAQVGGGIRIGYATW